MINQCVHKWSILPVTWEDMEFTSTTLNLKENDDFTTETIISREVDDKYCSKLM